MCIWDFFHRRPQGQRKSKKKMFWSFKGSQRKIPYYRWILQQFRTSSMGTSKYSIPKASALRLWRWYNFYYLFNLHTAWLIVTMKSWYGIEIMYFSISTFKKASLLREVLSELLSPELCILSFSKRCYLQPDRSVIQLLQTMIIQAETSPYFSCNGDNLLITTSHLLHWWKV